MKKIKDKTLILDYSKWRCGLRGENMLGDGVTLLLNQQGYMCCLGQFSLQLSNKLTNNDIFYKSSPGNEFKFKIPLLTEKNFNSFYYSNTEFSIKALKINDDGNTKPSTKIRKLRSLLKKYGYKLKVINKV